MKKIQLAYSEVQRNFLASPVRTVVMVFVSIIVASSVALATVVDVNRIEQSKTQLESFGAHSFVLVAPGGKRPDAQRCQEAENIEGVRAAGGVMSTSFVRLSLQPDITVRNLTVTPGYIAAAWPNLPNAKTFSVAIGPGLSYLGLSPGSSIFYSNRVGRVATTRVDAVIEVVSVTGDDRVLLESAIPQGTVESCLVTAVPAASTNVSLTLRDWFGVGTSIQDVLNRSPLNTDPQLQYKVRFSQFGWAAGGFIFFAILLGFWVSRRNEFALYRLLGFSEVQVFAMLCFETFYLGLLPAQLGALMVIWTVTPEPFSLAVVALDLARLDLALLLVPVLAIMILPRRSILKTLKGH
ncbi:MAG: hypothetical protein IT191_05135 [Microbacteriaceae bacterium]|nr:hypothetical protein [Microbacteriaceae bacterium]